MIYRERFTKEELKILDQAREIAVKAYNRGGDDTITTPTQSKEFFCTYLAGYDSEQFAVLWLDSQHRMIGHEIMFSGSIGSASIYPREVAKQALLLNAAAAVVAHNHPSGNPEPSQPDRAMTRQLKDALELIDVRLLDHIVVGETCTSFVERGWLL